MKSPTHLRSALEVESNKFNHYRKSLTLRGLIDTQKDGCITLALPRFEKFVEANVVG